MATVARGSVPYSSWLKVFKHEIRSRAAEDIKDEVDGYLGTQDFTSYHAAGLDPQSAADNELSSWN